MIGKIPPLDRKLSDQIAVKITAAHIASLEEAPQVIPKTTTPVKDLSAPEIQSAPLLTDNSKTMAEKSGDQYFPIIIPSNNSSNGGTSNSNAPTEDEKRKQMIMWAAVVLIALIALIGFMSMKKA